jgi:parallel beta-helix repeat protein
MLYVGGEGPGNYSSIQEAVDHATEGDSIYVFAGEYVENVIIEKSLFLFGEEKNATIINGGFHGSVVTLKADGCQVEGFTVKHSGEGWQYAGVMIEECHEVVIKENRISDNKGHGVFVKGPDADHHRVFSNVITDNVYGLYVFDSAHSVIADNHIVGNVHGAYLVLSEDITVEQNVFTNEWSGLHVERSHENTIQGNLFEHNADGVYLSGSTYNTICNNTVDSNYWFGLWLSESSHNSLVFNSVHNNDDIGIYLDTSDKNEVYANDIVDNDDGLYVEYSTQNTFSSNRFKNDKFNAFFVASSLLECRNTWQRNYWGRPRLFPKAISGTIKLERIHVSWVIFDWHTLFSPDF